MFQNGKIIAIASEKENSYLLLFPHEQFIKRALKSSLRLLSILTTLDEMYHSP